jgi:branched-chain amino acid transport system ATP-binding protein
MPILEGKNLTRAFGGLVALREVTLEVHSHEILGIIGPNGAGKTTCFNVITGFYPATRGTVLFEGKDISSLPMEKRALLGMVRTFQHTSLFPKLTVYENVLAATHRMRPTIFFQHIFRNGSFKSAEKELSQKGLKVLEFLGLREQRDVLARNLPYGSQRKLEIAIALATAPKLLLLDEPAAGMDPVESQELMRLIKEIQKQGIAIMLVEHNMKLVMGICDRLVVLNYGSKIAEGKPTDIAQNTDVINVYLGKKQYHFPQKKKG